jgi:hypothetical protein
MFIIKTLFIKGGYPWTEKRAILITGDQGDGGSALREVKKGGYYHEDVTDTKRSCPYAV